MAPTRTIFVIDDDPMVRGLLKAALEGRGFRVEEFQTGEAALRRLGEGPNAVCLDLMLEKESGIDVLKAVKERRPETPVVMITGSAEVQSAVDAMKAGAYDYIQKPLNIDAVLHVVAKAVENHGLAAEVARLRRELCGRYEFDKIIGRSHAMQRVFRQVSKVLDNDISVLVTGESGTGKELIARAIHYNGLRKKGPFVDLNCAVVPETLQESEMFGHERGAFTGAVSGKRGRFELAHGGTLFLDEVGTMAPTLQAKLLRVLQEQAFERVGGKDKIHVDARIVSATHDNLERAVEQGRFREDLYYRLVAFPIQIPPLRDRKEDLPALIAHCLKHFSERARKPERPFSSEAMAKLLEYHWPGNIRELENVVYRAVVLAEDDEIGVAALAPEVVAPATALRPAANGDGAGMGLDLPGDKIVPFDEVEKRAIERALKLTGGNISRAARELRIGRATFYRKLEKYDLAREAV